MSIWLIRGDKQNQEVALEEAVSYVGFHDVPDLSDAASREAVLRVVRSAHPDASENRAAHHRRQLFAFAHRIEVGNVLAILIAITTGIVAFYKFQERWLSYRSLADTLKEHRHRYLPRTNPYAQDNAFQLLV